MRRRGTIRVVAASIAAATAAIQTESSSFNSDHMARYNLIGVRRRTGPSSRHDSTR